MTLAFPQATQTLAYRFHDQSSCLNSAVLQRQILHRHNDNRVLVCTSLDGSVNGFLLGRFDSLVLILALEDLDGVDLPRHLSNGCADRIRTVKVAIGNRELASAIPTRTL